MRTERHLEDVCCEEADRGSKPSLAKRILCLIDAFRIQVDGGDATVLPDPLAEAFDPER